MAISNESLSAASEPPTETVAPQESAGRLILVAVGWSVLVELASGVPVGLVTGALRGAGFRNVSGTDPIGLTVLAFLAGCMLLIATRRRSAVVGRGNRRQGVGDGPIKRWWLLIVLALLTAVWAFFAAAVWHALLPQWVTAWRNASPWTLAAFTMLTIVLSPLAEELFFRGWLWTGLRRHWRAFPTALLTCSLWLAVHIGRGVLVPIILLPTAIILGFARHFCGIRAAIVLHAAYNLVVSLVLLLLLSDPSWDCLTTDSPTASSTALREIEAPSD